MAHAEISPTHDDDRLLAARALGRDEAALREFARRMTCVPRMLASLDRRLSTRFTADEIADLAQDVTLIVWRKLSAFEGRSSLESWVYRFAFLEIRNALRKRDRRRDVSGEALADIPGENPATPAVDAYALLARCVEELAPPAPEVIRLKHFEHLTFDQISERLGIPGNTAKTIYYRSLKKLRTRLAPRLEEEVW